MQRTEWAEQFAEQLAANPLVHEFVFRNLKYADGTDKEVCDLLLTLRNQALVIQMKCQEDPSQRVGDKLQRWVLKQAEKAAEQLGGRCTPSQNASSGVGIQEGGELTSSAEN